MIGCGATSSTSYTDVVEVYQFSTGEIKRGPSLDSGRSSCCILLMNDDLYVSGGEDLTSMGPVARDIVLHAGIEIEILNDGNTGVGKVILVFFFRFFYIYLFLCVTLCFVCMCICLLVICVGFCMCIFKRYRQWFQHRLWCC